MKNQNKEKCHNRQLRSATGGELSMKSLKFLFVLFTFSCVSKESQTGVEISNMELRSLFAIMALDARENPSDGEYIYIYYDADLTSRVLSGMYIMNDKRLLLDFTQNNGLKLIRLEPGILITDYDGEKGRIFVNEIAIENLDMKQRIHVELSSASLKDIESYINSFGLLYNIRLHANNALPLSAYSRDISIYRFLLALNFVGVDVYVSDK